MLCGWGLRCKIKHRRREVERAMAVSTGFIWFFSTQETGNFHHSVSSGFCWCSAVQCVPKERGCNSLLTGQVLWHSDCPHGLVRTGVQLRREKHNILLLPDSQMPGLASRGSSLSVLLGSLPCVTALNVTVAFPIVCLRPLLCFFPFSVL